MTKIQRASIYLFLLFAGIGLEFELGHLSQQMCIRDRDGVLCGGQYRSYSCSF